MRKTVAVLWMAAGVGCQGPGGGGTPPSTSATPHVVPTESAPEPVPSAPPPAPSASAESGGSPWPAGTDELTLSWIVHPAVSRGGNLYGRHVDLEVRAGAVSKIIGFDSKSDGFTTSMQVACNRPALSFLTPKTVAEIVVMGGDYDILFVERAAADRLEVLEDISPEGRCSDAAGHDLDACPSQRRSVASIPIPAGVKTKERFLMVIRDDTERGPETGA